MILKETFVPQFEWEKCDLSDGLVYTHTKLGNATKKRKMPEEED